MKGPLAAVLLASALSVYACPDHLNAEPFVPAHWLATMRNATGNTSPAASFKGAMRLIRFAEGETPIAMTEEEAETLAFSHKARFFDVTDQDLEALPPLTTSIERRAIPTAPTHATQVNAAIALLSQNNLVTIVNELAAFNNRYYTQTTGVSAATAIFNRLSSIASGRTGVTVNRFTHTWAQPSVIARIAGSSTSQEVTIVGAHLDSIGGSATSRAPGADDDASGVANIIEAFRAIVASGFQPVLPLEFHFYAAEEVGLRGSQAIANSYRSAGRTVKGMMQLDMTAYTQPGLAATIGWVTDRTTPALTTLGKALVTTYVRDVTNSNDFCGYACSDHASWNTAGYPTVYPFEAITETSNPSLHTASDTTSYSGFSFAHMHRFSKLVVGFMIEMSFA